jgi:uncharacterized MnhB-related membrane protein
MSDLFETKSIGYMTYNKFNMFMTLLLVVFCTIFALFSNHINSSITFRTVLSVTAFVFFSLFGYYWMLHD